MAVTVNGANASKITYDAEVVDETFFNRVKVYERSAPSLGSISITTPPTKTTYTEGEALDVTGVVITAIYLNGTTRVLSSSEYTYALANSAIIFSHTEDGELYTASQPVTILAQWNKHYVSGDFEVQKSHSDVETIWIITPSGTFLATEPTFPRNSLSIPKFDFSEGVSKAPSRTDSSEWAYWAAGATGALSIKGQVTSSSFYAIITSSGSRTSGGVTQRYFINDAYTIVKVSDDHVKGDFIESVTAQIGTYPDDGEQDGYWYEKVS